MASKPNVWIVIPAYNEASKLAAILEGIRAVGFDQVVVVDDGSVDNTAAKAREYGAVVVRHAINRGAGAATETGLEYARRVQADLVVTFDGDGQHLFADIPAMIKPLLEHTADVVIGSRFLTPNPVPTLNRFYNRVAIWLTFALAGMWVSDSQSGMRAFNAKALQAIHFESSGYDFASELFAKMKVTKLRHAEVPISVVYDSYGRGKGQNFVQGAETVFRLIIKSLMR